MPENAPRHGTVLGNAIAYPTGSVLGDAPSSPKGGNPWHDPKTGRFSSGPGQSSKLAEHGLSKHAAANIHLARNDHQEGQAKPLLDKNGHEVRGANGTPAVIPENFDIRDIVKSGDLARITKIFSPITGQSMIALDLLKFRQGGSWDIQRTHSKFDNRFIDSATILIGIYAASAGIEREQILEIENRYAHSNSRYRNVTKMDNVYTNLPERNVHNTDIGMKLVLSGLIKY